MRRVMYGFCLLLMFSPPARGNVGAFSGSGHTLQLVKSADVQLVSEDVTMTPVCGASLSSHSVVCRGTFVLRNRSAEPVTVQVGFPLDAELHGPARPSSDDAEEVLARHFIVRDANDTYHVRYAARDGQDKYSRVFLWDMRFAAGETKTLQVGYILPMSFTAHTTRKTDDSGACSGPPQHEKPWHARIEACILLSFVYVTETGQSWAGPIEKATFRLRSTVFEHDLQRVPEYVGVDPADPSIGLESANAGTASIDLGPMADLGFVPGMKLASVLRRVSPEGWEPASFTEVPADKFKPLRPSDGLVWRFADYRPGPPLTFRYYLVGFPESAADCSPWVRQVLGEKPDKADLLELREIVAAFFGIAPKTDSVKRFVEQQVWYDPSRPMDESQLSRPCQAVLTQLRTLAAE